MLKKTALLLLVSYLFFPSTEAAYTIKDGKLIQLHEMATKTVQEHYSAALEAYEGKNWDQLIIQSNIVLKNFPDSPFSSDSRFFLAVGLFQIGELESASKELDTYLKESTTPKYFEEAIMRKFDIAQLYHKGSRKHLLGLESLPKWIPAKEEAIALYDEVISALPYHQLAVQSYYAKAELLLTQKEFKECIDTYQTLIRKFPRHPLVAESYAGIAKAYLEQCQQEYPDPDYLDLAEINFSNFKADLPLDPKITLVQQLFQSMQEVYATSLYETAKFYERTKKETAAVIYYNKILSKYPETTIARRSDERLAVLEKLHKKTLRDSKTLDEPQNLVKTERIQEDVLLEQKLADTLESSVDEVHINQTPGLES